MTSLDELRRTLDEKAQLVPDVGGVIEAAHRRANRLRRRRAAVRSMLLAAGAVALVIAGPTVAARVWNDKAVPDNVVATPPPYRETHQFTVELPRDALWWPQYYAFDATTQYITARGPNRMGDVYVHDPGSYDATALRQGRHTTVGGHDAYFVPDLLVGKADLREPAIGWQDSSGAWVIVTDFRTTATMAQIAELAERIRLTAPRDLLAPVSFTYLPPGMSLRHAFTRTATEPETEVGLYFGPTPVTVANPFTPLATRDFPFHISAVARSGYIDGHLAELGPATKLAGLDTWERTQQPVPGWGPLGLGEREMIIRTATCMVAIWAKDGSQVSSAELRRIVEGASFSSCAERDAWVSPVP
jgi:hypothetical protein